MGFWTLTIGASEALGTGVTVVFFPASEVVSTTTTARGIETVSVSLVWPELSLVASTD